MLLQKTLPTHSFQPGERVTVFGFGRYHRPHIEGIATIAAVIPDARDCYRVRFEGERRTRARLVHPGDWQAKPNQLLEQLIAQWRVSLTPDLLREFFPVVAHGGEVGQ